jgi:hypothetical protein
VIERIWFVLTQGILVLQHNLRLDVVSAPCYRVVAQIGKVRRADHELAGQLPLECDVQTAALRGRITLLPIITSSFRFQAAFFNIENHGLVLNQSTAPIWGLLSPDQINGYRYSLCGVVPHSMIPSCMDIVTHKKYSFSIILSRNIFRVYL